MRINKKGYKFVYKGKCRTLCFRRLPDGKGKMI